MPYFSLQGYSKAFGLTDLAFADDIALFGDGIATVQAAVNQVH